MKYYIQIEEKEDVSGFVDLSTPTNRAGFNTITELLIYTLNFKIDLGFYNVQVISRKFIEEII